MRAGNTILADGWSDDGLTVVVSSIDGSTDDNGTGSDIDGHAHRSASSADGRRLRRCTAFHRHRVGGLDVLFAVAAAIVSADGEQRVDQSFEEGRAVLLAAFNWRVVFLL